MSEKLSKEAMEQMIQKYKEEAMRYRSQSHTEASRDLYQEQIPSKEVLGSAENNSAPVINWSEKPDSVSSKKDDSGNPLVDFDFQQSMSDMTPKSNTTSPARSDAVPPGEYIEDGMRGMGDVLYSSDPITLEEAVKDGHFQSSSVPYDDSGRLQIEVTAGERSLPISFADILVLRKAEGEKELERYLQTDINGNSPVIELPAPSRNLSEQPEPNNIIPYGVYTVVVAHADYYTTIVRDVQIFAGLTALLPVSMIPLSEKDVNPSASNHGIETGPHSMLES